MILSPPTWPWPFLKSEPTKPNSSMYKLYSFSMIIINRTPHIAPEG